MKKAVLFSMVVMVGALMCEPATLFAGEELPYYLRDRGTGVASSMFGTYMKKGEMTIYPYYEYYYDQDAEYKPEELGFGFDQDLRGKYRAHEFLIFLGYGLTERLALELEAAYITATLYKSEDDPSDMPDMLKESGLGDVEAQARWRWNFENDKTPEFFSYLETVFPTGEKNSLIGTSDWEVVIGTGMMKGYRWGTATLRLAAEYNSAENVLEFGEYAVEYLKRVSPVFRLYLAVEGSGDEVEFITDLQIHVHPNVFIRINNALGVTSKATDWAPELGIVFQFQVANR